MFIIPFLIISIVALTYSSFFKVNFLRAVPLSMFTIVTVYYLVGFLNNLSIATYTLYLFSIISIMIYMYIYINRKQNVNSDLFDNPKFDMSKYLNVSYINVDFIKKQVFSVGFFLFLALYLIVYITNFNSYFKFIDEYLYWGPFVKDMCLRNKFYNTFGHIANGHIAYPPFIPLFEYFFIKTSNNICSQGNIITAYRLLLFSTILPVFSNLNLKIYIEGKINFNKLKLIFLNNIWSNISIIMTISAFIIINIIFNKISIMIAYINADIFLAFVFFYYIYNILLYDFDDKNEIKFNTINLIFVGIALILTKQIAIFLFLITFSSLILIMIIDKKISKKNVLNCFIIFIIPIISWFLWKLEVHFNNVKDQFDLKSSMTITNVIDIFFNGGGLKYQQDFLKNYFIFIFYDNERIFTLAQMIIVIFIFIFIISLFLKKQYKNRLFIIEITLFLGFVMYMFVLALVYLFNMAEFETVYIAGKWRYISTYLIALFLFASMIFIKFILDNKKYKIYVMFSIIGIIFLSTSLIFYTKQREKNYDVLSSVDEIVQDVDYKNLQNLPSNSKILIIGQGVAYEVGLQFWWCFFDKEFYKLKLYDKKEGKISNSYIVDLSFSEFIDILKKYDYIYFYKTDDYFWDKYGIAFNTKPNDRGGVYKISEIINN